MSTAHHGRESKGVYLTALFNGYHHVLKLTQQHNDNIIYHSINTKCELMRSEIQFFRATENPVPPRFFTIFNRFITHVVTSCIVDAANVCTLKSRQTSDRQTSGEIFFGRSLETECLTSWVLSSWCLKWARLKIISKQSRCEHSNDSLKTSTLSWALMWFCSIFFFLKDWIRLSFESWMLSMQMRHTSSSNLIENELELETIFISSFLNSCLMTTVLCVLTELTFLIEVEINCRCLSCIVDVRNSSLERRIRFSTIFVEITIRHSWKIIFEDETEMNRFFDCRFVCEWKETSELILYFTLIEFVISFCWLFCRMSYVIKQLTNSNRNFKTMNSSSSWRNCISRLIMTTYYRNSYFIVKRVKIFTSIFSLSCFLMSWSSMMRWNLKII